MRVKINRDYCDANLAFCERCMGQFLKYPMGYERRCFVEFDEGDEEILHVEFESSGHKLNLKLTAEDRQLFAAEGWAKFVNFAVPMYRDEKKQPELIRK